ncbi:MAG: GNAT family N-acetyltransferase [Bryobacterales bacterium]|nr:GNAT family N-acetyltransferase [Bryobacterales bacterium]
MRSDPVLFFRLAEASDYDRLERLTIDSFEPITWARKLDERFGPLNGKDWRERWQARFAHIFATQIILVGEVNGKPVGLATATVDAVTALGFIDLLCVFAGEQGKGYGKAMLRGMLRHLKTQGCLHANLDCLADNEAGNRLYASEGFEEVARSIRWFIRIPEL